MAAIDFPTATSNGQTFEADSGVIYTYVGTPPNGFWSGTFGTTGLTTLDGRYIAKNDSNTIQTIQTQGLKFNNGSTDTILIDGLNSRIGIGTITTSGASTYYDDLVINNTASGTGSGITLLANATNGLSAIDFGDTDAIGRGRISYSHAVDNLIIDVAGTEAARIDNSGNIGIGTTSVNFPSGNGVEIYDSSTPRLKLSNSTTGTASTDGGYLYMSGSDFLIENKEAGNLRFYTDATEAARIDSSGRLLVGTSSVSATSTIYAKGNSANATSHAILGLTRGNDPAGAGSYLGAIEFRNSSEGAFGEISCQTDGTTGSSDYPGRLVFSTTADGASSPTERMRIDSSGRLGVGTSSPVYKLEVDGGSAETRLRISTSGTDANEAGIILANSGKTAFNDGLEIAHGGGVTNFRDLAGESQMVIDVTSSRVGIGTTSPSVKLEIAHGNELGIYTIGPYNFQAKFESSDSEAAIVIEDSNSTDDGNRIGVIGDNMAFTTANSERARIDSSGRLLVGTSSNSGNSLLQVAGDSSSVNASGSIFLHSNYASASLGGGDGLGIISAGSNNGGVGGSIEFVADATWGSGDYPGRLVFSTTAAGASSPTERMRITSDGSCLFHKTASANLQADGFDVRKLAGGSQLLLTQSGNGTPAMYINNRYGAGTQQAIQFYFGTTHVGSITTTSTSTSFTNLSDYRLKENVVDIADGITRVKQLQPKRFNFISDADKTVDGFIAHEAQAVVPECVTGTKDEVDENGDPVYQGIDQSKLVPLLTAALQEALAKIETLELPNKNPINIRQTTSLLNNPFITFLNSSGDTAGSIIQNGVNSVTYATSSDYRLKENVVELTAAIPRLKQLAPKRFNFTAAADVTVDGFLAHEAQAVVPEAVTGNHNQVDGDGNPVMQGIDQSKLVPLLTAALQEAIGRIETLETKVATLEGS